MYLSMQINSKSLNALQGLTIYSPCQCPASAAVEQLSHGHTQPWAPSPAALGSSAQQAVTEGGVKKVLR